MSDFWLTLMSIVYPSFKVEIETDFNVNLQGLIVVNVEVIQSVGVSENICYAFTSKELIDEEENPIKEDLFYAMIFAGMDYSNSDIIICNIIMVARECISAEGYSRNDKLTISLSVISNCRNEDIGVLHRINQESYENGERPMPARLESVQCLPSFFYDENLDIPEECVICLKKYSRGSELITLGCGHKFDKACILEWLSNSNSCPLCRCII